MPPIAYGHILPYRGRNHSEHWNQNLLWVQGKTYVMDNHRAAAWCWSQHLGSNQQFSLFHIDRHYDLLQSRLDDWCAVTPAMEMLSIKDYLNIKYNPEGMGEIPAIGWDTYFPIFIKQRERSLQLAYFLTHCEGDKPWFPSCEKNFWHANDNLAYWLEDGAPWIVNVDMDYFFSKQSEKRYLQIFSDGFSEQLGVELSQADQAGRGNCITLAISPEMCGGWDPELNALEVFAHGLNLTLPAL
jgi:hypothetical protein